MPKVGDQVIIEGRRLGEPRREGTLIGTVGPLINVRWNDGTVSLFKPGAGSVSFTTGNGGTQADEKPAKAAKAKVAPKASAKKAKKKR